MKVIRDIAALAAILCFLGLPFDKITNGVREVLMQTSIMEPKSTEETYRQTGTKIQIEYQTERAKNSSASRASNVVTWKELHQEVQRSLEEVNHHLQNMEMDMNRHLQNMEMDMNRHLQNAKMDLKLD